MNSDKSNEKQQEPIKTVRDTEVVTSATKMMDRFDEAFRELAK